MSKRNVPTNRKSNGKPTGAGSEASRGEQAPQEGVEDRPGGSSVEHPGSEPLSRTTEHEPGYGGKGGEPRTGSQERE